MQTRHFHGYSYSVLGGIALLGVGSLSGDEPPVTGVTKLLLNVTGQECSEELSPTTPQVLWTEGLQGPGEPGAFSSFFLPSWPLEPAGGSSQRLGHMWDRGPGSQAIAGPFPATHPKDLPLPS